MSTAAGQLLIGVIAGAVIGGGGAAYQLRSEIMDLRSRLGEIEEVVVDFETERNTIRQVVFADNFSNNAFGWDVPETSEVTKKIERGKYVFEAKKADHLWWSPKQLDDLPRNYAVRLRAQWIEGDSDSNYGLYLGWDQDNYLTFGIAANSHARVQVRRNGDWDEAPVSVKGLPEINVSDLEIRVVVHDEKRIEYFVDDFSVGQFSHSGFDLRRIGMFVGGEQKVEFDSIVVETATPR